MYDEKWLKKLNELVDKWREEMEKAYEDMEYGLHMLNNLTVEEEIKKHYGDGVQEYSGEIGEGEGCVIFVKPCYPITVLAWQQDGPRTYIIEAIYDFSDEEKVEIAELITLAITHAFTCDSDP